MWTRWLRGLSAEPSAGGPEPAPEARPGEEPAPRRLWPGALIAAGLLVAVIVVNLPRRPGAERAPPAPERRAAPAPAGRTAPSPAPASPTVPLAPDPTVLDAASRALEAWGWFAVSGDLSHVRGHFAPGGPQMRRFEEEAPGFTARPLGPPPYEYRLQDSEVAAAGPGERRVRAAVAVARPGEPDRTLRWELELRWSAGEGRWQVWSVSEGAGGRLTG